MRSYCPLSKTKSTFPAVLRTAGGQLLAVPSQRPLPLRRPPGCRLSASFLSVLFVQPLPLLSGSRVSEIRGSALLCPTSCIYHDALRGRACCHPWQDFVVSYVRVDARLCGLHRQHVVYSSADLQSLKKKSLEDLREIIGY